MVQELRASGSGRQDPAGDLLGPQAQSLGRGQLRAPPLAECRRWRGGRGQRLGPWCPPLLPVPHIRPPRTHLRLAARFAFGLPPRRPFLSRSASAFAVTGPRLLATAAPIPEGRARWILLPPFNPGCGRGRHEPSFGQSNSRKYFRPLEMRARGRGEDAGRAWRCPPDT